MVINPQSQKLYQTLLNSSCPLSAKELSDKLHIYPNLVYRLCTPLIEMGLIDKVNNYPSQFVSKPPSEGLSLFLLHQSNWFSNRFSSPKTNRNMDFSFVQGRDELIKLSAEEIDKATKTVDLLRSGHEIPAEVMLSIINANRRGVVTRMLIQDYSPQNSDQVMYWVKNRILIKRTNLKHIRLMIYDSSVSYFMSYKHTASEKDMGMKVNYPPFAAILSQLFNQWWKKAEKV